MLEDRGPMVPTLMEHDLVDEYGLMVFPVVLGCGRRPFPDDAAETTRLQLVDSLVFESGVAVHTYRLARPSSAQNQGDSGIPSASPTF